MRDMGYKIFFQLVQFVEPTRHRVEILGELGKFIVSRGIQAVIEFALRNSPSSLGQMMQGIGNGTIDKK